jgi:hypothetical protein
MGIKLSNNKQLIEKILIELNEDPIFIELKKMEFNGTYKL